jgi:glyoxylase-like metal-dependent hydrolase (beta-lactamase superfamily II)
VEGSTVLEQVAESVHIHRSGFCRSNTVVVDGGGGVLLIDPGILRDELVCLASDLAKTDRSVVGGFSTHPHWDHLLWHTALGGAPRYGTARCADTARARLSAPDSRARVAAMLPPDIADQVPLDLLGEISGLPVEAKWIPWDGPRVRIVEHQAHAPGHAALLIEGGVLVAGDMLSDVLVPMLDLTAPDPIGDYFAALQLLEEVTGDVDVLIPGHGAVGGAAQMLDRIDLDRAYLHAVAEGETPSDPRIGPSAPFDWVAGVHERQLEALTRRR